MFLHGEKITVCWHVVDHFRVSEPCIIENERAKVGMNKESTLK